eukprot:maker-scaffold888_size84757-snap-gene-0.18 protein:Tk02291 transcript:maker-scaffold888_size84757-snap-gene-0.18-mRNA-1 annotation:"hypothetical protein ETSY2_15045"
MSSCNVGFCNAIDVFFAGSHLPLHLNFMVAVATMMTRFSSTLLFRVVHHVRLAFLDPEIVKWDLPIVARLKNNLLVHTSPPPSSGVVLASVLATLSHLDWDERDYNNPVSFHLFIEALKFGFAKRTRLGDWNMLELRKTIKQVLFSNLKTCEVR